MEDLKNSKLRYIKDFFAYAEESFIYVKPSTRKKGSKNMRVNAKERKTNARQWYSLLTSSYNNKSAVIVKRYKSKNPNIFRVQLLACNTLGTPVVIAESVNGIWGCLYELFQNIEKSDIVKILKCYTNVVTVVANKI